MNYLIEVIKQFICKHDPQHIGAFLTDILELTALAVMLGLVIRLYIKTKRLHEQMKEYHPND